MLLSNNCNYLANKVKIQHLVKEPKTRRPYARLQFATRDKFYKQLEDGTTTRELLAQGKKLGSPAAKKQGTVFKHLKRMDYHRLQ